MGAIPNTFCDWATCRPSLERDFRSFCVTTGREVPQRDRVSRRLALWTKVTVPPSRRKACPKIRVEGTRIANQFSAEIPTAVETGRLQAHEAT
jgi:hypothetical protein